MKEITVNGEVYVSKKDIKKVVPVSVAKDNPYMEIGKSYFIRTVTHYFTGILIWVGEKELVMESVCWIADTGKYNEFLKNLTVNESEPYPKEKQVIIGRGSIIDMSEHELILTVK